MTKCKPCPSKEQIKELEQLSKIFSSDLSNWSHTTPTDSTTTMRKPRK